MWTRTISRMTLSLIIFAGALPALANQPAGADKTTVGAATHDAAVLPKPATETVRGVVESFDEGKDVITLRLSSERVEQFRVQDGLVFNAIRFGDDVEVTVQDIAGARTIVGLK